MKFRQAFASKSFAGTGALTVALLATFGACSVDTDGIEFVPDDEFNKGAGASGGSGNNNTGGEGGTPSDESCEPGDRRCSSDGLLQTCVDGDPPTWSTDQDCKAPGRCSVLRNKCLECTPGEYRCKDAELEQCDMAGERFEPVQTCADADACNAKGQTGYCTVCEPGETYCEGEAILDPGSGEDDGGGMVNQVRTCAAGGGYTELNVTCQGNEPLCNLEQKNCSSCVIGTYSCQGTDLYKCGKAGYLEYVERCDSAAACKEDTGECDNSGIECVLGQDGPRCDGDMLQTCRSDGKYHDEKKCGSGLCKDGYEDCLPCDIDNPYTCNGETITACLQTGWNNWYTSVSTLTCHTGSCSEGFSECGGGQCLPGSVRCLPGYQFYEQCNNDGYPEYVPCPGTQICYGTTCVNCQPGAYRCDGNTLKQCNNDGLSESTIENCSVTNMSCDARVAKCTPYGGTGRYFCNADGDFTYMDVDGNTYVEQYCDGRACDPSSGCYGISTGCTDGMLACDGRRVRVCDNGYYERQDVSCSNNTACQPAIGCTVPVALAAGYNHTCAILADPGHPDGVGYAVCWGDNSFGQLGNGAKPETGGFGDSVDPRRVLLTFSGEDAEDFPVNGFSIAAFTHLSAGRDFTCADVQDPGNSGEYWVMCWGSNEFGQLGGDNPDPGPFNGSPQPFFVHPDTGGDPEDAEPINLRHVSAGDQFACALAPGGAAWCWGRNDAGQLGIDSEDEYRPYATEVEGGHSFVEIAAGARHACAVTSDGSVYCWGDNKLGQLGLGKGDVVRVPTKIEDLSVSGSGDAFPALGRNFSAILAPEEGSPRSWGANIFGQLGDGGTMGRNEPAAMSSARSSDARALFSSSTAQHQCLRDKDDKLFCVGANVFGQLGDKTTVDRTKLVQVWDGSSDARTLSPVRDAVAVGGRHTCAINALNEIWCWGANHRHQLGSTKATPQTAPGKVF